MKPSLRPLAIYFVLGVAWLLSTGGIALWYIYQLAEHKIESEVDAVRQSFSQRLNSAETVTLALQDLAHASAPVHLSDTALQNFAESVMERNSSLVSVLYYRRIPASERSSFEASLSAQGIAEGILNTSPADPMKVEPAAAADEYYVLTTADRRALGDLFVGWNLLSDKIRSETLKKSLLSGQPVSTDAYLLSNGDAAVEIMVPVYQRGRDAIKAQERGPLTAVIGVVVNLTSLLGDVELRRAFITTLNTRFNAKEAPRSVYRSPDESIRGFLELPAFNTKESFDLYTYEIILGMEKKVYLSQLNYGILIAVLLGATLILFLGTWLARSVEKINAMNRDLERKVEERTRELQRSKNEVQEILDNLDDAVMIIDDHRQIQPLHSPSAPKMLGRDSISGATIDEVLFRDLDGNDEAVSRHRFTLSMLFHADSFQWDISQANLLRSVKFHNSQKGEGAANRTLSVRYAPLFENDSLERMLIIVSDITEILNLRQDAESARVQSNQRLQIVSELLQADRSSLPGFFDELEPRCKTLEALQGKLMNQLPDAGELSSLFREIHTLKGNARMLKMVGLSQHTHHFEDDNASVIADRKVESLAQSKAIGEGVGQVLQLAEHYQSLYREIFAGPGAASQVGNNVWNQASHLASIIDKPKLLRDIFQGLAQDQIFAVSRVWASYQPMVDEIASQLGKDLSPLRMEGEAFLARNVQGALRDAITHIVRNALDHGIEKPEERGAKAQKATIQIALQATPEGDLDLQLVDDGRGIDPAKIWSIAKKKGLVREDMPQPSASEVIELLFASGFSTKDQSSDISGRGVGLDAVRSGIEQLGGKVFVTSEPGQGSRFHLILPKSCVFHFQQASGGHASTDRDWAAAS